MGFRCGLLSALMLVFGCGDQGGDSFEAGAFSVQEVDPSPNSASATPRSDIGVLFSRPFNPLTVSDATVWLVERASLRRVPVDVSFVTQRGIRLTPRRLLETAGYYTVVIDGVEDYQGRSVTHSSRFYTAARQALSFESYQAGALTYYFTATLSANTCASNCEGESHSGAYQVSYGYPGPDLMRGTADDVPGQRSDYTYDDDRDPVSVIVRREPGADEVFGTGDDVILYRRDTTWTAKGTDAEFHVYPGDDGQLDTGDDIESGISRTFYDAEDRDVGVCRYEAGPDGVALTADDTTTECTIRTHGSGESVQVTAVGPGDDGLWRTADDVLAGTFTRSFTDADGNLVRFETHNLAGDGTPTPSDETRVSYVVYDDAVARIFNGAGVDGQWDTADDVAQERVVTTLDAEGRETSRSTYAAGADGLHDTGDDVLLSVFNW